MSEHDTFAKLRTRPTPLSVNGRGGQPGPNIVRYRQPSGDGADLDVRLRFEECISELSEAFARDVSNGRR
jgi:hypothetical protein